MFISIHILVHFSLQKQCFTKKVIKQKSAYCLTQIKKSFKIDNVDMYVTYIYDNSKTNLKIKDKIISINDKKVNSKEEIHEILKNKDKVNIKVINNGKEYDRYAYLKDGKIGIIITYDRNITTYPKIKYNNEKNEYGSSGGLMTALVIYNKLISYDITKGYKIAGTGTIDEDGTVGEIDGVKYKLKGAVKDKADVFLVPSGNYEEAIKLKEKNNYKIKIIEVKTFEDAIDYLKK